MMENIIERENNHTITEPSKPNKAETGKVRVAHLPLFSPTHPHLSERCALARHLPPRRCTRHANACATSHHVANGSRARGRHIGSARIRPHNIENRNHARRSRGRRSRGHGPHGLLFLLPEP